jgi:cytochrome c553
MKNRISFIVSFLSLIIISCNRQFASNGETIYRTGKNSHGDKMIDKSASRIKLVNRCVTCHGKEGNRMKSTSIRYADLANPALHNIPYTDALFFRFLDEDLKSDGTKANIGVIWKMSDRDKKDLLAYLKTL